MTVLCPKCRRAIRVPPEKEDVPGLKARCAGCGTVFEVAEASLALAALPDAPPAEAAPRAAPSPPVAPAPTSTPARPAAPTRPTAGSAPRPPAASPNAARPTPSAAVHASTPVRPSSPASTRPRPGAWRRCANHPSVASRAICSQCGKGWCAECVTSQGQVMICPPCDAVCLPVAEHEAKEAKARMRARALTDDLGTVLGYPLSDKTAFLMLAVFVGIFSVAASFAVFGA